VLAYALLAYAVTWALWLPYYLSSAGLGLLPFPLPGLVVVLGQYGPSVAAFTLAAFTGGGPAVRGLIRRYGQWRVSLGWYLLVIVGPLALLVLTLVGRVGVAPLEAAGPDGPSIALEYLLSVLVLKLVLGGALGEEAGWRGFALPRLQARHGPLRGSLILGAIWAGWHAPLYLDPVRVVQNPPLPFAIGLLALAVVYTWVYNHTGGSLLLAILLHAGVNSAPPAVRDLVPGLSPGEFFNLVIAGYVAAALLLITATRGRLGAQPDVVSSAVG
jgi:membrane protease YdiL (CAAX protease family)